jgi:hypothetical protein
MRWFFPWVILALIVNFIPERHAGDLRVAGTGEVTVRLRLTDDPHIYLDGKRITPAVLAQLSTDRIVVEHVRGQDGQVQLLILWTQKEP